MIEAMLEHTILISDFAGHAFTYELADALKRRGHVVSYGYCAANISPRAGFAGSVVPIAVGSNWRFDKYRAGRRLLSEVRYGLGLARSVWQVRPTDHVVCNMPVVSGTVAWFLTLPLRVRNTVWFQDVQSGLAAVSQNRVGRLLSRIESFLLRRADHVIAISAELAEEASQRGVAPSRIGVLENWAPVALIPQVPTDSDPAHEGLDISRPLFIYSGTLARKHDPSLLMDLAVEVASFGGQVAVISEGEGADWLRQELSTSIAPPNLVVLPYQPFDRLPEILGAADVLVVILEVSAGRFSVPSKTLTYLCTGRPILASIPLDNAAARLVADRAQAGKVTPPEDRAGFLANARELGESSAVRSRLGEAGRRYAEEHFAEDVVVRNFLAQLD